MYKNIKISMAVFIEDKIYDDQYKLKAELNGITVESYSVRPIKEWASAFKCSIRDIETRSIKRKGYYTK